MDVWVCRGCGGVVPLEDATCPVCGGDREGRSSIVSALRKQMVRSYASRREYARDAATPSLQLWIAISEVDRRRSGLAELPRIVLRHPSLLDVIYHRDTTKQA